MNVAGKAFGSRVRVRPQVAVQYKRPQPDPDRPVREVIAEFARTPSSERLVPGRAAGSTGASVVTAPATLVLSAGSRAALGYDVRVGDRVDILDEPDRAAFAVAEVHPFDGGNLMLVLDAAEVGP